MKQFKKWALVVLGFVSSIVGFFVLVNCLVDTYGILRTDFSRQFHEPNMSFIKIKYLLRNNEKFDSFLFGSSRVNNTDVKKIRNGSYYNMTYSEGVPKEHLENIKFLMRSGVQIKNILIGLDDFSYLVDPQTHYFDLMRQPHPAVSGKSSVTFYADYFMKRRKFEKFLLEYLEFNYGKANDHRFKKYSFDMYDSGRVFCRPCEAEIESDVALHVRDKKFEKPMHYEGDNIANTLADIRELVAVAQKNHINLVFFINPIHKTTYLDTNLKQFFKFKKELVTITNYFDFSGLNPITTNNYYYFETSHYRPMVGDMMLRRMFGYPPVAVTPGFGALVTRENVEAHLRGQCNEIQASHDPLNKINEAFIKNNCTTRMRNIGLPL